jgi:hypothetical protein
MVGERKMSPRFVILAAVGLAIAVIAPIWAFFNVTVPFPPMLADDHGVTTVNTPVNINLLANDADADGRIDLSSVTLLTQPAHGIATVDPQTGVCTYAPGLGYEGNDKFSYQLRDDEGISSNTGFVAVLVLPSQKK